MRSIHLSPSRYGKEPHHHYVVPLPFSGEAFCLSLLFSALFCLFLKLPVFRQVAGVVEFVCCHVVAADAVAQAKEGRH